ncbi:MAG: hypothetical protein PHU06_05770 [Gallionella sp.]|nr:hypothetical protein [Gallionella sp.]MDD4958090.1 hypothetical protein [Gallionella sp.]
MLALQNDATDCFFWLQDKLSGIVYFEATGQKTGGDSLVKECTILRDGVHIVLYSGEIHSIYFDGLSLRAYLDVVNAMRKLYSAQVLEVFDA